MTPKEMAARLHGRQYRSETTRDDGLLARQHGLVIVYGASDDLVELEGAISDELGANNGTKFWVTPKGLVGDFGQLCDDRNEQGLKEYFEGQSSQRVIEAIWCPDYVKGENGEGASWAYQTTIPHETFDVMEDDDLYCRGIVFALADVGK